MPDARGSEAIPFFGAIFIALAVAWAALVIVPYRPFATAKPVKSAPWLKTNKDQSRVDPIKPIRVATVSYRLDPPVQKAAITPTHERTTLPWSCETIRSATAKLKPEQIARLARLYRLTSHQIVEARRCLKENRT